MPLPVVESRVSLRPYNSFGLPALAERLVRIGDEAQLRAVLADPALAAAPRFVLGGGSNIVLTHDLPGLVLKVEIAGRRVVSRSDDEVVVEAGAGENWHDFVAWTLDQGLPGLENLALIPGSVGAAPVQNIGAYGVELKDRFDSLDAIDLQTGRSFTLRGAECRFGYRDSVFKHELANRCLITRVRFVLPQPPVAVLGYLDLERKIAETGVTHPNPRQVFDWICAIRRAKLPDPAIIGNAGSFFKNPVVTPEQCRDIIARDPAIVHYPMADGSFKLAAGWLIDACGWKGKSIGQAGVYEKQALVLVNRGQAIGGEIVTLARAIQESVYGRFGIRLEPEPVVL
ncbi:UDP-N-acetylmuramate dehydrogenase [uncultured Methylibium sp.]|uniref:UDP-N-acetylmuramate dehydrogenase n=1 Tax=uncultured Methylibium sp. TaxID=381093 RepID=UPI0025DBF8B0|nr:UDP-N-acetylmuramate dehydrogenase [uncultured Methylibium sp.]